MTQEQRKLVEEHFNDLNKIAHGVNPYVNDEVADAMRAAYLAGADYAFELSPRWISVEDELPPIGKQVLVFSEHNPDFEMWWSMRHTEKTKGFGQNGKYLILTDSNDIGTLRNDDNEPIEVTHWMPLPEPPQNFPKLKELERTRKKGDEQ